MGNHWQEYVEAAGLADVCPPYPETYHALAGRIMHDYAVFQLWERKAYAHSQRKDVEFPAMIPSTFWLEVLNDMTPEQKQELRARMIAKAPTK